MTAAGLERATQKRWTVQKHDREAALRLAGILGVRPLTAALLIARGHDNEELARRFLEPSIDHLCEPALLKDIDRAARRILKAIEVREKILIWGDYDVDGTTGTTILRRAIRELGADTEFHIPNRFTEGYGINIPALESAKSDGCSLVVTVDCGTRSFEPIEWAQANGIDVIVTDHHLSDDLSGDPKAFAIVNPNRAGCTYPEKDLAGVGVAFKLAQVLLRERGKEHLVRSFLKIAAIGTVADIMKLTGENRAIVALGLKDLPKTNNYGLKALMEAADCRSDMTSYHIGFRIAPRINAAGRMDVARHVVELFEADDFATARRLAALLDSRNRERQTIQQTITDLALAEAAGLPDARFIVIAGENWHRGVIGLAASRIAERLHRPTIVLSLEDGVAHGSARSIRNYNLVEALDSCSELFDQYGGHSAAAGMRLDAGNIGELRSRLDEHAKANIPVADLVPELRIDAPVAASTISLELVDELTRFEPFGAGNPKPVFVTNGLRLRFEPTVMKEKHLKLYLEDTENRRFEAVWWHGVERAKERTLRPGGGIEIAYTLEANMWQGTRRLQLVVEDLREDN